MTRCRLALLACVCLPLAAACGKSSEQVEQEEAARQAAMRQAIQESLAEEHAKDQRMREEAAAQAGEHIERDTEQFEEERARVAAARPAEVAQSDPAEAIAKYMERLRLSVNDPPSLETRNAQLSPRKNGMCAEFNARDKSGNYAGFKRVVVTESAVNPEEPPNRDTLSYFLAFQVAARDTGCFPDVQNVHVLR